MLKDLGVKCHEASYNLLSNGSGRKKIRDVVEREERQNVSACEWGRLLTAGQVYLEGVRDVLCDSFIMSFEMKSYQIKSWWGEM